MRTVSIPLARPSNRSARAAGVGLAPICLAPVCLALVGLACGSGAAPTVEATGDAPGAQETATARGAFDRTHATWTRILAAHVQGDRFDYAALKKDTAALDAYLRTLAAVTPAELAAWPEDEQLAFFINAYNAHVVSLVTANYPLASINDLSTEEQPIWKRPFIPLGAHLEGAGAQLSLDQLEHALIRERFSDARIHVAVNCAAISCPPLRGEAYRGGALERQLDEQLSAFLNDPDLNRFDAITRTARVSKLFEWYREDFARETGSVQGFLARHGPSEHRIWLQSARLEFLEYDWALNDVPRDGED